ncbi:MAG: hypothetical protein DRR16_12865 [Candidatus Parabeggiatoa sp. nov. 3]|nr:MAG: hypothetical protein DRR00_13300 [Gammaproteobacteria bacterium]RKZ65288.1 MAG: hypothetical protein DRQ99_13135 [Gammaproteobacteria bacterium]RKZ85104.1 MAG: hypothetical protein DRR16_12865 [Gammaproteobacteria bacterium]
MDRPLFIPNQGVREFDFDRFNQKFGPNSKYNKKPQVLRQGAFLMPNDQTIFRNSLQTYSYCQQLILIFIFLK